MELKNSFRFFANRDCAYFPCHPGADPQRFNCLFCYCPLYALGPRCGGKYTYDADGIKDCSACTFPHDPDHYDVIVNRFQELAQLARRKQE